MRQEEYDARRRQLDAERRRAIELIDASYHAQVRALDLVWLAAGGQAAAPLPADLDAGAPDAGPPDAGGPSASAPAPESPGTGLPSPPQRAAVSPALPVRPAAAPVLATWEVIRDINTALPRLPEVFTTSELLRVLGYVPHRGTLHRLLAELVSEKVLSMEKHGEGRRPSRFRQLSPAGKEPGEAQ